MKRDEDHSLSMSPPMANSTSSVYSGFHPAAAASALGMLSPSILAANRTAAAIMAARLPMSTLASVSSLFPHHPALFGSWHQPPTIPTSGPHSPPASPISPLINTKKQMPHNNNNNNKTNNNNNNSSVNHNNNNLVSTSIEVPTKKARKISLKKDLISPSLEIPVNAHDIYTSGPISPPSSGSSPNSNTEGPAVHTSNNKDPSRDKCFTCKICNRSFGYKHVLQNHERTHTGEKPFECPECHKRFTRDHHLKTHMRLHTGEKPYHCSHCDRQFVQVANLRRHLRVHTGERPYSCDVCEARFSDSNQLKSHILIHNGEKPFECDRCHLKFRRRHHLMHHKCGIQSPPTPAMSPATSDLGISDQKSAISSFAGSDESTDLNKTSSILLSSAGVTTTTTTTVTTPSQQHHHHHLSHLLRNHHHQLHTTTPLSLSSPSYDTPLDLSEDGILNASLNSTATTTTVIDNEKRSRKSTDIRRVLRLPPQFLHIPTELPEQTEPEDLSMHSPRSRTSLHSPISSHHDDDLEDLDEAATLYLKQRQKLEMIVDHHHHHHSIINNNHRTTSSLKRHLIDHHKV